MSDIETIKARIRKLMAVAGDGVATEGEIDNAMRLAAKLLDAHHLSDIDIPKDEPEKEMVMGEAKGVTGTSRLSTWESALAWAIVDLFGCLQHYRTFRLSPIRVNGVAVLDNGGNVKQGEQISFYGPVDEAKEAADLFNEWSRSIATMGIIRWGGCYRGDGAMYCMGFASALREKAKQINGERNQITAKPLPELTSNSTNAITLSDRYSLIKESAKDWISTAESGPKLKLKNGYRSSGYRSGDSGAYSEGRTHGNNAAFSRTKITSNSRLLS